MRKKENILFLCTGNSCRSQIAEGFTRTLRQDLQAFSAGVQKTRLNPRAIQVMREIDIDISGQCAKTTAELPRSEFDLVVTLCDHANEHCPIFPGAKTRHAAFDDPPQLTRNWTDKDRILRVYRRVRDEIRDLIQTL